MVTSLIALEDWIDSAYHPGRVIDVGANNGDLTQWFLDHGRIVYAFEPVPVMVSKLNIRFAGEENVRIYPFGLSDDNHTIKDCSVLSAWTLAKEGTGGFEKAAVDQPPFDLVLRRLDDVTDIHGWPFSLIKIDVDGYELRVLRGAERIIQENRPAIMLELGCYLRAIGDTPRQLIRWILDHGYKVRSMDGDFESSDFTTLMSHYPHTTTCDVMLIPQ